MPRAAPHHPPISLQEPTLAGLAAYAEALAAGWSPDSERDASAERLTALLLSPEAFLRDITGQEPTIRLDDGQVVPRLPARAFWIWDGTFSGTINLRWQPGSEDLPAYVSGHVGYTVVPWRRRRGYATRALALLLPVAWGVGLRRVLVTCDPDNEGSRRAIEANGGVLVSAEPTVSFNGRMKLRYWVPTA